MSLDMTSFAAALKTKYSPEAVQDLAYKDNPLLAMVSKTEDFGGENKVIAIKHGNPQNRSATFATAQSTDTNALVKKFTITRANDFSIATIDNETMEASKGNANALMEAATTQIDGALASAIRSLAISLYGNGSGSIGQCNASVTGTSLQLKNADDVTNFEVGQELVFSTADGGGSVKAGSVTVVGVNRDTGELTVDALSAIASGAGVAANDYVFVHGDYDKKVKGLRAWIPDTAPTATPFFGLDRSADVTRLGGIRFDGSALPIEEALQKAAARAAREGARPDVCFINYSKYTDLELSLGSKVQYVTHQVGEIGFRGIVINGPRGPIKVIPDQNCPSSRAFMLQMDTWKLHSLGKCPRILDSDGLQMLRQSSADGVEVRIGYRAQLACNAPGMNVNVKLD